MSQADPKLIKELIEALEVQKREIDIAIKVIKRLPALQAGESSMDRILRRLEFEAMRADSTRKDQVAHFLNRNGPHSRKEIIRSVRIPPGSVDSALNDKETFQRLENGEWDVVRASSDG